MIKLDAVDKLLEINLAGAVATTELPFVSGYVDINQTTFKVSAMSELDGTTNGAASVTVVAVPGAGVTRVVQFLSIYNVDTAPVVLTVNLDHGATDRIIWKCTLAVGDTLIYTDTLGFKVTDANGQVKTGPTVVSLTSGITGILPGANGGTGVNNGAFTITLAGTLQTIGAFATILRVSAATDITLPTTGTLVNTAVTTLSSLVSVGTITTGVWNAGAVTSSGLLTVNGFGTHSFSAGGAGGNVLGVTNTTDGTANYAQFVATSGTTTLTLGSLAQSFTTSGLYVQAGSLIVGVGAGGLSIAAVHASGAIRFYSGGTTLRATLQTAGTWTWAPYGVGTITSDASGNLTSVSDIRYKDRISSLPYGLAEVLQLNPIQHGYNDLSGLERNHLYGGFIAQEVQKFIPLAVGQMVDGYLTLADRPILGAVVNAIKTHETRIAALEARMN